MSDKETRTAIAENVEGRIAGALKQTFGDTLTNDMLENRAEKMAGLFALWASKNLSQETIEELAE